jgi:hypothetical protein
MNNGRSNENLREELEGRQMALMHLNMVGGRENYKNFHRTQITALQRELNRRAKARAVGRWKKMRGGATALSVIDYWHKRTHRAPGPGNVGGEAYRRIAGLTTYRRRSPNSSPRRRSPSRSRSPRRRSPNKSSPGRSPRRN